MVTPGDLERERPYKFMETAPKRSKPLHNFSMPPGLRWGNQMVLRCKKVNSDDEIASSSPDLKHHYSSVVSSSEKQRIRSSPPSNDVSKKKKNSVIRRLQQPKTIDGGGDDGIEEIRAKLMFHLRTAAHKMKFEIPKDDDEEEEDEEEEEEESSPLVEASAAKPWNLRKRRAACNAPTENGKVGGGGGGGGVGGSSRNEESKQQNSLALRTENQTMKSLRLRGNSITDQSREKERRKFSIPLSRKEIDEDFMAMLGTKPSRRPTKRPKIVQKQLDAIFPGLWLSEVTVDTYRVPDLVEPGKR